MICCETSCRDIILSPVKFALCLVSVFLGHSSSSSSSTTCFCSRDPLQAEHQSQFIYCVRWIVRRQQPGYHVYHAGHVQDRTGAVRSKVNVKSCFSKLVLCSCLIITSLSQNMTSFWFSCRRRINKARIHLKAAHLQTYL